MIDSFLADLFAPEPQGGGPDMAASFGQRFSPAMEQPLRPMPSDRPSDAQLFGPENEPGPTDNPRDYGRNPASIMEKLSGLGKFYGQLGGDLGTMYGNAGGDLMTRLKGALGGGPQQQPGGGMVPMPEDGGGGDDPGALPPNAQPMAGTAPPGFADRFAGGPDGSPSPMVNPPMPRPRPDIEGRLNGTVPPGTPPGAAPVSGGAPGNIMARLLGNRSGSEMAPLTDGAGGRDRGTGPDARIKRVLSALAGGMAGGNPNFKGGAFMKGMSGGLTGGLKSDKEEREAEAAADDKAQKQGNFDRTQFDKEKTSEALRKLYGERGAALLDGGGKGGKGAAWNKPPHERLKDAEKLIIDKQKSLYGQINPLSPKAERTEAQSRADKELEGFKKRIYKTYGIDENGNETSPSMPGGGGSKVPNATPSKGSGGMRGGGSYEDPHVPTTQEEFDKVPPGGYFINPADGEIMRKKAQKTSALDDGADDEQQDAA